MAKYGRFDPRNKKKGRHKSNYLHNEKRIREERKSQKYSVNEKSISEPEDRDLQTHNDMVLYKYQE